VSPLPIFIQLCASLDVLSKSSEKETTRQRCFGSGLFFFLILCTVKDAEIQSDPWYGWSLLSLKLLMRIIDT